MENDSPEIPKVEYVAPVETVTSEELVQSVTVDAQNTVIPTVATEQNVTPVSSTVDSADGVANALAEKKTVVTQADAAVNALADRNLPTADATAEPRQIKLLIPEKRFRGEGDSQALRLSYDDIDLLKIVNMEPVPANAVDYFPKWLTDLDGQRIRVRGFMYPTFEATGLKAFTMARDNGICCFVRQPLIYDIIGVRLADGETTDYIEGKPFDVEGVFHIVPEADDGELYQLYRIEDAQVLK